MKYRHHTPNGPLDEREWEAQERALQAEATGAAVGQDPLVARYRVVARALRQPMPPALPANFAQMMAARVGRAPLDLRVERTLTGALTLLLLASALVVAALYGGQWLRASLALLPPLSSTALDWVLAGAAGVAMSWALSAFARRGTFAGHAA
jgi:hypothetical protein